MYFCCLYLFVYFRVIRSYHIFCIDNRLSRFIFTLFSVLVGIFSFLYNNSFTAPSGLVNIFSLHHITGHSINTLPELLFNLLIYYLLPSLTLYSALIGFVYFYLALYYITGRGTNIRLAQYLFAGLYIILLALVFRLFHKSQKVCVFLKDFLFISSFYSLLFFLFIFLSVPHSYF